MYSELSKLYCCLHSVCCFQLCCVSPLVRRQQQLEKNVKTMSDEIAELKNKISHITATNSQKVRHLLM